MSKYHYNTTSIECKKIPGFPGYELFSNGRIKSYLKLGGHPWIISYGRYLDPAVKKRSGGYYEVDLCNNGKVTKRALHILMLEVFVGPRPDGCQACHNDGNRFNNDINNLRWDTQKNNQADRIKHGTNMNGSKMWNSKLKEEDIPVILDLTKWCSSEFISKIYGVSPSLIKQIKKRTIWKHVE